MMMLHNFFIVLALLLGIIQADAAGRFWVGGTGPWDASTTTHWAASTGGAGGQTVPGSSDAVTFDGSSGGGTVTVNTTVTVQAITASAFTGTLDFSANNNNVTLSNTAPWVNTGAGTRTINMGNGLWTFSGTVAVGGSITPWAQNGATNLTFNANGSTLKFSGSSAGGRIFSGGGFTYNNVTFDSNAGGGGFVITQANTFATLAINGSQYVQIPSGSTQTVTALVINGASGSPASLLSSSTSIRATVSVVSGAQAQTWAAFQGITFTGGATFTATNSFDLGANSGITITSPGGGGGGGTGSHYIGGGL